MIKIKNLTCSIQKKTILNHIHLEIQNGDFWLIFGPNGAGKTTLLKIISGLLRPCTGEVLIDSGNISHKSRKEMARKLSYLPQFDDIALPLSVKEILLAGRYPYTSLFRDYSESDNSRVMDAVEQMNLKQFLSRDINTLSGGERKKVMLASAFIQDVPVILLDEPFTFLDPQAVSQLTHTLQSLHEKGKTLVAVSHHLETLFPVVTHMAALKEGNLIYSGKKLFDKALLRETYGVNFSTVGWKSREVIFIDE